MPRPLNFKFILFTDTSRAQEYARLSALAYNDSTVPATLSEEVRQGIALTKRLDEEAKRRNLPVETVLRQNLGSVPLTFALVNEENNDLVGTIFLMDSEYIRGRAKQANDLSLSKEIEAEPDKWGTAECICVKKGLRGHDLGRKLLEGLFESANKMGLKGVAGYCAEDRFAYYTKKGMDIGGVIKNAAPRRPKIGKMLEKTGLRDEEVSSGISLGTVLDFFDAMDKKIDHRRDAAMEKLGPNPTGEQLAAVKAAHPEIMRPVMVSTALVVKRLNPSAPSP